MPAFSTIRRALRRRSDRSSRWPRCTNVLYGYGKKTFWNVGGPNQIEEFKVPQKLIKTLSVAYSFPSSCAMDTSGDLAVGILEASGPGSGDVVIFKNASGSGTAYTTPLDEEFFDGYDNQGNLFADDFSGSFALIELPKAALNSNDQNSNTVGFPAPSSGTVPTSPCSIQCERAVSIRRQRNDGDVEGHRIVLGFQRLRADLDRSGPCLLRRCG